MFLKGAFLALSFALPSIAGVAPNPPGIFPVILSDKVCFLHVVDKASGWSPYCGGVDFAFLGLPQPGPREKALLQQYAEARLTLGWEEETRLFLWAKDGFPLQDKPEAYGWIKKVLDQLAATPVFLTPLSKRAAQLQTVASSLQQQLQQVEPRLQALAPVVNCFKPKQPKSLHKLPTFALYATSRHSWNGGANGEGIYGEIDPDASPESLHGAGFTFLHEALHQVLKPRACFATFLQQQKTALAKTRQERMEQSAPDENGNDEYGMLDEVIVCGLANAILEGCNPDAEYANYTRQKDKTLQRTWDGVRLLLPILKQQLAKPQPQEVFFNQLLETFLKKVHFAVWVAPKV